MLKASTCCLLIALVNIMAPSASAQELHFVTVRGEGLYLDGKSYTFLGINRYNILTTGGYPYVGCGGAWSESDLDKLFLEIHSMGANAVRFWVFQSFIVTTKGTNFDRMDYIVNTLAPKYQIKVIPVLENEWQDCSKGGKKYDDWYQSGYLHPYGGYTMSYQDYLNLIVSRYKGNPHILMWQLMNEAEDKNADESCASGDSLYRFASSMSDYIKSIDHNHMVSLGTIGTGQCGTAGIDNFRKLHSIPTIDVIEAHDYGKESQGLPGELRDSGHSSTIASDVLVAHSLNKPLFIGEAGIKSGCAQPDCYDARLRAKYFDAKINALFATGGVGYLIWSYRDNAPASVDYYGFGSSDPLYGIVKELGQKYLLP